MLAPNARPLVGALIFPVGLIMIDLVQKTWGGEPVSVPVPIEWRRASVAFFGMQIQVMKIVILAVTLALMAVLHWLISRTAMMSTQ